MPYEHKKVGKNDVVVQKADSGKVVGHTTPGKLNKYLAALHIHSGDNAASGGIVEIPKGEFIEEHERLMPKLEGQEKKDQMKELKEVRGYAYGGEVEDKVKKNLIDKYNQPQVSYTPPQPMARGGIVSPYPENRQMIEETNEERHPEAEDREFMARGGIAGMDNPYDLGISQSTTTAPGAPGLDDGTTSGAAYMPTGAEATAPDYLQPKFDPNAGLPPAPPVAQTPVAPVGRPLPRGVTGNPMGDYLDTQRAQLGKYGPEQLQALQRQIAQERTGLGRNLAGAGGMFADTIISGVAGANSPGFGASIENEQARRDAERLGTFEKAGALNTQQVEAGMKLDAMDPKSDLSKGAQETYRGLLESMGLGPYVGKMSAQNISDVTGKSIEKMKAESEAKMAAASLGLRQQSETREAAQAKEAAHAKRTEQAVGSAKELYSKASIFKPSTWGTQGPAQEILEKSARGEDVIPPAAAPGWKYLGPVGGK